MLVVGPNKFHIVRQPKAILGVNLVLSGIVFLDVIFFSKIDFFFLLYINPIQCVICLNVILFYSTVSHVQSSILAKLVISRKSYLTDTYRHVVNLQS